MDVDRVVLGVAISLLLPVAMYLLVWTLWVIHTFYVCFQLEILGKKDRQNPPQYIPLCKGKFVTKRGVILSLLFSMVVSSPFFDFEYWPWYFKILAVTIGVAACLFCLFDQS